MPCINVSVYIYMYIYIYIHIHNKYITVTPANHLFSSPRFFLPPLTSLKVELVWVSVCECVCLCSYVLLFENVQVRERSIFVVVVRKECRDTMKNGGRKKAYHNSSRSFCQSLQTPGKRESTCVRERESAQQHEHFMRTRTS